MFQVTSILFFIAVFQSVIQDALPTEDFNLNIHAENIYVNTAEASRSPLWSKGINHGTDQWGHTPSDVSVSYDPLIYSSYDATNPWYTRRIVRGRKKTNYAKIFKDISKGILNVVKTGEVGYGIYKDATRNNTSRLTEEDKATDPEHDARRGIPEEKPTEE